MNKQKNKLFFIFLFCAFLFFLLVYIPTWKWMYERWTATDSYSSHGFIIPLVSIGLLWSNRHKITNTTLVHDKRGFLLIFLGLFIHVLSGIARVHFTSAITIPIVILGMILLIGGKKFTLWAWFSIFYLLCMVPFPLVLISFFTLKLKLVASEIAVIILDIFGIVSVRDGSIISFVHTQMIVGDVCSGLRSLVSMIALGIPFAYITQTTLKRKLFLLVALPPIAFLSNILRVLFLAIVTYNWGGEAASGTVHDMSGLIALILNIFILFWLSRILTIEAPKNKEETKSPFRLDIKYHFISYILLLIVLGLTAIVTHLYLYQDYAIEQTNYSEKFPLAFGNWRINREYPIDSRTIEILETKDILMRHYQKGDQEPILLSLVISDNSNRKVSHPPEICYKGAGCEILEKREVVLKNNKAVLLKLFNGRYNECVIYWYKFGENHTANFYYHQLGSVLNFFQKKQGGAALIRMSTKITDNNDFERLAQFAEEIFPLLNKYLP